MKKTVCSILAALLMLSVLPLTVLGAQSTTTITAVPTTSTVFVNGETVGFDAYNIRGYNYFKLRDLAFALTGTNKRFEVEWDGVRNTIIITSDAAYTAVGGEMTDKGAVSRTAVPTNSIVCIDGLDIAFEAYNIENNNYFKLRDIGIAFDFAVDWNSASNAIAINTSSGYTDEPVPLSDEALAYFNGDDFFNGEYMNIRNQFMSSLYSAPGEIDLRELFYCGSGLDESSSAEEEKAIIFAFYGDENAEPVCGTTKISRVNIEAILSQYMGLTLDDTDKVRLDEMTYLEDYDAYYIHHGDTNYRRSIAFSHGEREGDIIRLFYDDTYIYGKRVLALRESGDSYFFVSNQMAPRSIPEPPQYTDKSIDTATVFADYFVEALKAEYDLTGNDGAMNSWRDLFDFGQTMRIHRGDISEREHTENVFQFIVYGLRGGEYNSVTVLIDFQDDEPRFFCSYTFYYPWARSAVEHYLELLAENDVSKLAVWLGVDSGPEPLSPFIEDAEQRLAYYSVYDLNSATVTNVRFDNDAQRFLCDIEDAQGAEFTISLIFGDGLIMPENQVPQAPENAPRS